MKHVRTIRGIVLGAGPGQYLRHTDADWGPRFMAVPFEEAAVFNEEDTYYIDKIERQWGAPLERTPVRIEITKTMVRDYDVSSGE